MSGSEYVVCPSCGGDRDSPGTIRGTLWTQAYLCGHAFHRGGGGYELTSQAERERVDERRAVPQP